MWLQKLIIRGFIDEKIWEKHRVRRYEVEEALTHRQAIRLRHKKDPVRSVVIGATQGGTVTEDHFRVSRQRELLFGDGHGVERQGEETLWEKD